MTALENITLLENIRSKIIGLSENISDSSFRSKWLNSLPRRFCGFVSACNLNQNLELSELISALVVKDHQLNANYEKHGLKCERFNSKDSHNKTVRNKPAKIEGVCFVGAKPRKR